MFSAGNCACSLLLFLLPWPSHPENSFPLKLLKIPELSLHISGISSLFNPRKLLMRTDVALHLRLFTFCCFVLMWVARTVRLCRCVVFAGTCHPLVAAPGFIYPGWLKESALPQDHVTLCRQGWSAKDLHLKELQSGGKVRLSLLETWIYQRGGIGQPFCLLWDHQMHCSLWRRWRRPWFTASLVYPGLYIPCWLETWTLQSDLCMSCGFLVCLFTVLTQLCFVTAR